MTYDPSKPPPPFGLVVLGRHGAKFKVRIGALTKIVDRETVLRWAAERRVVEHMSNSTHTSLLDP